jgi:F-type H+-transporting ATPase subunit b
MEELLKSFGIDYKLLLAQIFNFFLIFFVLYKFLFKPISKIIEERERKIAEGLKNREEAEKLMERIKKMRKDILKRTYEERKEILAQTEETKKRKIEEILKEVVEIREKMLADIEKERKILREKFYSELESQAPKFLLSLYKKIFVKEEFNDEFIKRMFLKNDGS